MTGACSTVLPEPDSPTMRASAPGQRERDLVDRCTVPAGVRNAVERLSTTSRRSALPSPTAPGIACPGSSPGRRGGRPDRARAVGG